jgi:chemotaxis protein methyltransferase CheR
MRDEAPISDQEFALFQRLICKIAGISLADSKKILLVGRLQKRLQRYGLSTFSQYYRLLASNDHPEELQTMVDLLTTNETYFFREPKHFDFLRDEILFKWRGPNKLRIWSAASSTGEEPYTLAMLLAEHMRNDHWEIVASDLSTQVLEKARRGHYPLERNEGIPANFLAKYCLKGIRSQAGTFLISPDLRKRVSFHHVNLTLPIDKALGIFEVIFLRNVMIYFELETKRKVLENLLPLLAPGGHLIIGHSETLNGLDLGLSSVRPTIYRKP